MSEAIFKAVSNGDYAEFAELIRAYVDWCRARYKEDPWVVEMAFSYQSLDKELEQLSTSYGGPNGTALLVARGRQIQGCVAYRKLSKDVCEMKRLFVPDRFRGKGLGKVLCEKIIEEAKSDGLNLMRLDTGNLFHEAQNLYRSLGFKKCEPYYECPKQLLPFVVFMERPLI